MKTLTMIVDRNNLRRACDDGPLHALTERIVALARDSVLLVPRLQAGGSGSSRLGGEPVLPEGEPWPVRSDGAPLAFIAQIDLAELARFPAAQVLPSSGDLLFFYDTARQPHDFWTGDAAGDGARIVHVEPGQKTRRASPQLPAPTTFAQRPLNFTRALTIPSVDALAELGLPPFEGGVSGEQHQAYLELYECVFRGGRRSYEVHRMFGYPEQQQQGPCSRSARDPLLLLQLGTEGDFAWAGGGLLYFEVPASGLEARRFDRVHVELERS